MARGSPSLTALLGLLAVAGFQNRDKIAELLRGVTGGSSTGSIGNRTQPGQADDGLGGLGDLLGGLKGQGGSSSGQAGGMGGLGGLLGGAGAGGLGGLLGGGLGDLMDSFRESGRGDVAESWVSTGPNKEIAPSDLEQVIGSDTLATLSQQTGLSKQDILDRLSQNLPDTIDRVTPDGRLPTARPSATL
jgi:uncharacterized protein YidB (DUF937 family)